MGDKTYFYYVVYGAFDMKYFSAEHLYTILISAILFLSVFLIPIIKIFKNLKLFVNTIKHGALNDKVISRHGILTIGYAYKYYYWDAVILKRDFILNCVVTLFPSSTVEDHRVLVVGIVFFIYFYYLQLHAGRFPYNTSNLNVLERNMLVFATTCLLCQIIIEGKLHPIVD